MKNKKREKLLTSIIIVCLILSVSVGANLFFNDMVYTGLGMIFGSSALAGFLAGKVGANN